MPDVESTRKALEEGQLPPEGVQEARPAPEGVADTEATASDWAITHTWRKSCPFCGKQMRTITPDGPFVCSGCRFAVPQEIIQDQNREALIACIRTRFTQLAEVAGRTCGLLEEMAPLIAGGRPSLLREWGKRLRELADEAEMRGVASGADRDVWVFAQAFDWLAMAMGCEVVLPTRPDPQHKVSQLAQRIQQRAAAGIPSPPTGQLGDSHWGGRHLKTMTGGRSDAVLQFGGHQGQKVSDMAQGEPGSSYLHWILSESSFPDDLKTIIRMWITLAARRQP